jgi:predicted ATP-dependent endonuclease of OLD family
MMPDMKLQKVEVTDYKSVRRSNSFTIGDITCLVGKNESGKTALLEAIYRLNPLIAADGKFDITEDFPRSDVENYRQAIEGKKRKPAIAIRATFELEEEDLDELYEEYGAEALTEDTVTVSKGYDDSLYISVPANECAVVQHLVKAASLTGDVLKSQTLSDLAESLAAASTAHATAVAQANAIADPTAKAKAIDDAKALVETAQAKQLRTSVAELMKQDLGIFFWQKYLEKRFPKFLYFDEYYQMSGAANIEKLRERQQNNKLEKSDHPMLGLIARARLNLDEILNPHRTQDLVNKLQGASNHLSKQVLKYWSQNKHIRLQFDVRPARPGDPEGMTVGTNLWGMVYDDVHQVSTRLGTRSKGFIWFFSFLAWYSQQPQDQPLILLLDEPGLFLHGSAQGDFLRYMEAELKDRHQVIYTTHSPFMVDAKRFDRVRIVEDKSMTSEDELPIEISGTKVTDDILEVDQGTLFPLQGALGYEIAQTLFIGPNSLIVEGVSDLLYLPAISSVLAEKGRTGLSKEWVITPVGGSEKVPTFAALIGIQPGMNVATLIDIQKKDHQSIENIYKRKLLEKSHVLTYADFTGKDEADIEDMFEPDFYLRLVNEEFAKLITKPLALAGLPGGGPRILPRIEAALAAAGVTQFNHYRPSRYFVESLSKLAPDISDATLERFEKAFIALNKLL